MIEKLLPNDALLLIDGIMPHLASAEPVVPRWGGRDGDVFSVSSAYVTCVGPGVIVRNCSQQLWQAPPPGWMKLNSDDTRRNLDGVAFCGGVIRNDSDEWEVGFAKWIGICSVSKAELQGMFEGLKVIWGLDARRVIVELDSMNDIQLLQGKVLQSKSLFDLLKAYCIGYGRIVASSIVLRTPFWSYLIRIVLIKSGLCSL
ncbi:hypothetical protein V6N13_126523 [Hibiscus sabdariffa]